MRIAVVVPMLPPLFNWPHTIRLSCPSNLSSLRVLGHGCDFAPEDSVADDRVEQHQRDEQALAPEHERKTRSRRRRFVDGEDERDHVRPERDGQGGEGRQEDRDDDRGLLGNEPLASYQVAGARRGARQARDRSRQVGTSISAKAMARARSDHSGRTAGRSLGHFAIVVSSTFRCWATNAGGVCVSQSDKANSS